MVSVGCFSRRKRSWGGLGLWPPPGYTARRQQRHAKEDSPATTTLGYGPSPTPTHEQRPPPVTTVNRNREPHHAARPPVLLTVPLTGAFDYAPDWLWWRRSTRSTRATPWKCCALPAGSVNAVVTSPPYYELRGTNRTPIARALLYRPPVPAGYDTQRPGNKSEGKPFTVGNAGHGVTNRERCGSRVPQPPTPAPPPPAPDPATSTRPLSTGRSKRCLAPQSRPALGTAAWHSGQHGGLAGGAVSQARSTGNSAFTLSQ